MIKPIIKYPNPILKQKSLHVSEITQEIKDLAQDLIDTMQHANGVGISAVQIGILKRVAVVLTIESSSSDPVPTVLINPTIIDSEGSIKEPEGCLSFPGIMQSIERPEIVRIKYLDLQGNEKQAMAEGIEARCILHEIDHLDGKLFIDKLSLIKKALLKKRLSKGF